MSIMDTLITDRTQADVDARNDKGTYNASDLNRVGAAMNYVADCLTSYGYAPQIASKVDWTDQDWPTTQSMDRYLSDLAELRRQISVLSSTPEVPADMEKLTYIEANNIEKILEDIDRLLNYSAQAWYYSGDLFAGEV